MTQKIAPEKAVVFIDGNNFYHAVKKIGLSSVDLNYEAMSKKLVKDREWVETRYYVGKVRQEGDLTLYAQQRQFVSRLESFNRVRCIFGRIEKNPVRLPKKLRQWIDNMPENLPEEIRTEMRSLRESVVWVEKAVDVQIAVDMIAMAQRGEYDAAYLLSADGDFTPAVEEVLNIGRKVFVASPAQGGRLARAAGDRRYIRMPRDFFHGCWR